ncbi:acyl-CoA carboxylase subunit epsilon [Streptomyces sp. WELS2]|uniref:acyl-CoA carboxylase subunit epsilon n=1 Tax=Streptomyces sp. WELS2 TaxID=2749435 RepID=UPI0037DD2C6C
MSAGRPLVVVAHGSPDADELAALATVLLSVSRSSGGGSAPPRPALAWCRANPAHGSAVAWAAAARPAWTSSS